MMIALRKHARTTETACAHIGASVLARLFNQKLIDVSRAN